MLEWMRKDETLRARLKVLDTEIAKRERIIASKNKTINPMTRDKNKNQAYYRQLTQERDVLIERKKSLEGERKRIIGILEFRERMQKRKLAFRGAT